MEEETRFEHWLAHKAERSLVVRDGVRICYEVLGEGQRVMVLANGLGGRLYTWRPILEHFAQDWKIITWDYRGLFESEGPPQIRRLAVPEHAEDLREILDHEGVDRAILVGWSMGVQVSLEMASLYPERVERLILLNGTYGHVLQTGFQPFFRIPWLNKTLHELIDFFYTRPQLSKKIGHRVIENGWLSRGLGFFHYSLYRKPHFKEVVAQYLSDVFATNFGNYLRLFQELDSHSVYHLLRDIPHPVLIISGLLDILTPAYQSYEMERKLDSVQHLVFPFGTHFVLLEYPQQVAQAIARFVED